MSELNIRRNRRRGRCDRQQGWLAVYVVGISTPAFALPNYRRHDIFVLGDRGDSKPRPPAAKLQSPTPHLALANFETEHHRAAQESESEIGVTI
jgi:hypothetical protein